MRNILPALEVTETYDLMLDSGAFSAWTKKQEIDLVQYTDFALQYLDYFEAIVNLDRIPGEYGLKRIPQKEVELSAEIGWKNYEYMLSQGIPKEKLIHVFHQNENFRWLKEMVREIPYIGLSPDNSRSTKQKMIWLDHCMEHATDKEGMPLNKWHGFAVTSIPLMLRYPWWSVDSTRWRLTAAYGMIFVIFSEKPLNIKLIILSENEKSRKKKQHFENLPPVTQKRIIKAIEDKGYTLQQMRQNSATWRTVWNMEFFTDFQNLIPKWPWPFKIKKKKENYGLSI